MSTFAIEKAPSRAISITVLLIANQSRQRPGCRLVRSSNHLRLRLIEEQARVKHGNLPRRPSQQRAQLTARVEAVRAKLGEIAT